LDRYRVSASVPAGAQPGGTIHGATGNTTGYPTYALGITGTLIGSISHNGQRPVPVGVEVRLAHIFLAGVRVVDGAVWDPERTSVITSLRLATCLEQHRGGEGVVNHAQIEAAVSVKITNCE
jgi:hypothetical protein